MGVLKALLKFIVSIAIGASITVPAYLLLAYVIQPSMLFLLEEFGPPNVLRFVFLLTVSVIVGGNIVNRKKAKQERAEMRQGLKPGELDPTLFSAETCESAKETSRKGIDGVNFERRQRKGSGSGCG